MMETVEAADGAEEREPEPEPDPKDEEDEDEVVDAMAGLLPVRGGGMMIPFCCCGCNKLESEGGFGFWWLVALIFR